MPEPITYEGPPGASRVLVVDDEDYVLKLIRAILETSYRLATVHTAEEAIVWIEREPPDVLLADKNLPGMSGLELLARTKELSPSTEAIIITAYASLESSIEALRLGAFGYLAKPFEDIRVVEQHVHQASEKKRLLEERGRIQRALQVSEEIHRTLVETSSDVIALIDLQGRFIKANRRTASLLGIEEPDQLVSRSCFDFLPATALDRARDVLAGSQDAQRVVEAEQTIERPDGTRRQISLNLSPVHDADGKPSAFVVMGRDVTERKAMEAGLAQADRLASMGMLAAGVAHEINNPLTFVLANLESLEADLHRFEAAADPDLIEDVRVRVREGIEGARRARDIVRDLKTFSTVHEDQRVAVDMNRLVESATRMALNEIRFRARLIHEPGEIPPVLAVEGRISQVLLNLLVNAAQAIEEGHIKDNLIRVRTWCEHGMVCVEVEDTGEGIDPDELAHMFEPFHTTRGPDKGAGLGLAICHNIVSSHGGRIDVSSKLGQGTSFTIRLPAMEAAEGAIAPHPPAKQEPTEPDAGGRVLVIDDEPAICATLDRLLRKRYQVVVADGGPSGREILEQDTEFDLILCDLMMPGCSGMELYDWLSGRAPDLAARMVFITGGIFTPKASEFINQVHRPLLDKPFDSNELQRLVAREIAARRRDQP